MAVRAQSGSRAAAAVLALACAALPTSQIAQSAAGPGAEQFKMLELVNLERASRDLAPLVWNETLARLAAAHARDMSRAGRISHNSSSDGATFSQRAARSDLRARAVAENVGVAPDLVTAHRGLMDSPGHRANILDGKLGAVGIGLAWSPDGRDLYVTQDFAAVLPDLNDVEAATALRGALRRAANGRSLPEDDALSRRLADAAARLSRADSVTGHDIVAPPPSWVFTFTSLDPDTLPKDLAKRVAEARGFGLGVAFARTKSTPLGAWWVAVVLTEGTAQP